MQAWLEGSLNELSSAARALSIGGILIEEIFGSIAEAKSPVPDQRVAFSALKQGLERSKVIRGATLDKYIRVSIQHQDLPADDARYRFFDTLPLSQWILLTEIADPDAALSLAQQVAEDGLTSKQLQKLVAEALGKPVPADSRPGPASLLFQMRGLSAQLPIIAEWAHRGTVQSAGELAVASQGLQQHVDVLVASLKESLEHSTQTSRQSRPAPKGSCKNKSTIQGVEALGSRGATRRILIDMQREATKRAEMHRRSGRSSYYCTSPKPGQCLGEATENRSSEDADREPGAPRISAQEPGPSSPNASFEGIAGWIETRVRETTGIAKALTIGDFIIDNLYGSVAEAQSRSPRKRSSLRAIEARLEDKGLLSIVTLNNYVRIAIGQRELPSDDARYQVFDGLSQSQRLLLTRVEDLGVRLRLAQRAAKDKLTCKQLEALVAEALGNRALVDKVLETVMRDMREITAELLSGVAVDGAPGALFKAAVQLQGQLRCLDLPLSAALSEAPRSGNALELSRAGNCKDEEPSCPHPTVRRHTKIDAAGESNGEDVSITGPPQTPILIRLSPQALGSERRHIE